MYSASSSAFHKVFLPGLFFFFFAVLFMVSVPTLRLPVLPQHPPSLHTFLQAWETSHCAVWSCSLLTGHPHASSSNTQSSAIIGNTEHPGTTEAPVRAARSLLSPLRTTISTSLAHTHTGPFTAVASAHNAKAANRVPL